MCDNINITYNLVNKHLKCNNIFSEDFPWMLHTSPLGDRGLFSTRDINPGEIIFIDNPLILGPRVGIGAPLRCTICFESKHLITCSKGCGIIVCREACENSINHQNVCNIILNWKNGLGSIGNITRYLAPIKALLLDENQKKLAYCLKYHEGKNHGFEVDSLKKVGLQISEEEENLMRIVCSVMDANAFQVAVGNEEDQISLRGLYPLAGLANHRCYSNATHVFDNKHNMIVTAATFIPKGTEIFHTYTRLTWSTLIRRYHLSRTKHFTCNCKRCLDPTEFGSYLSAIYCDKCHGMMLPRKPLYCLSEWKCISCDNIMDITKISLITSTFGSRLGSFKSTEVDDMILFLNKKLLPENNHIAVELKFKLIWILGHYDGYKWKDMPETLLNKKHELCRQMLLLLETLQAGQCKLRASLLYEVYCCLGERHRRIRLQKHCVETNNNYKVSEETQNGILEYLQEASKILKYDVNAPIEIKEYCKNNNKLF